MPVSPYIRRLRESIGTDLLLLPAAAVLPRDDIGRVLLVRQSDTGRWATIGGSVEVDEPPETTEVGWFSFDELAELELTAFASHALTALGWLSEDETKRQLRVAYDARAAIRDAMDDALWKQDERERFLTAIRRAGVQRMLEIGAGHGVSGRFFADQGLDVTCIDLAPELVSRCRAKGLTAHVMDFAHLEFPPASFDAVFGMNCLLHVPRADLDGVLRSVRAVLGRGGLFYWGQYGAAEPFEGVYDGDDYEPKRFFSFLTSDEIQRAAADGFATVDYRRITLDGHRWGYHALVVRP